MKIEIDVEMGSKAMQGLVAAIAAATAEILAPRLAAIDAACVKAGAERLGWTEDRQGQAGTATKSMVVSLQEACALTGLGKTTIWRREKDGDFPGKVRLSAGRTGYKRAEVLAWIESRQAA